MKEKLKVSIEPSSHLLTLEELTVDVSAFIYFLSTTKDAIDLKEDGLSFWMLIPNGIDVRWSKSASNFYLEKEIFSRIIYIVHPPVPKEEEEKRRAELLSIFSPVISNEQTEQIKRLLKGLKPEAREQLILNFKNSKNDHE